MWVVRVALQRPYSFGVLALPIATFGVLAALNTPTGAICRGIDPPSLGRG
jgi:hypothetical protein